MLAGLLVMVRCLMEAVGFLRVVRVYEVALCLRVLGVYVLEYVSMAPGFLCGAMVLFSQNNFLSLLSLIFSSVTTSPFFVGPVG